MILTNPPSRSTVQDDVLRGVPLQEMLPRKGIATVALKPGGLSVEAQVARDASPKGDCDLDFKEGVIRFTPNMLQEMLPRKGIATNALNQGYAVHRPLLQEMLPRKGIATRRETGVAAWCFGACCKRCFPERGLRQASMAKAGSQSRRLQEMLPRKGIATEIEGFLSSGDAHIGCKRCFPERGLRLLALAATTGRAIACSCKRCFPERGLRPYTIRDIQ